MILRSSLLCAFALVLAAGSSYAAGNEPLTFEEHVRPVLKSHCFQCHGEEEKPEAGLDVRLVRSLLKGGDSGPAIALGKAAGSLLLERLESAEMPPPGKGKPLSVEQIAIIREWLVQGGKTARPESEAIAPVTAEERSFWSFQPLQDAKLPVVTSGQQVASPIDAFLLAELQKNNLAFSPLADSITLIRRASIDLTGLSPAPSAVEAFLADESPDAWERLLDRLLASPHYGERWGRHWLDVAGYADSDGYTEKDPERKYAYKFRDYIIRALNADKPWDQLIREQLAGDELLAPPYENLSPEQADRLAATGFLRMAPDGTADGGVDQNAARNDVVADTIKIVSTSLLGMTVGCAQCHDHRYDPIPQADYYRWRAIFEPSYDWKRWRKPAERLVSLWSAETRQAAAVVDADLKKLAAERQAALDTIVSDIFDAEVAKLPEDAREVARQAKDAAVASRTPQQKQLLKDQPSLNVSRGSAYLYDRKRVDALNKDFDARQKTLQATRPAEDFVPCLTEIPGHAPPTHVFFRGDVNQPRQAVEPGELTVLAAAPQAQIPADDPALPTTGRRLAYANWLASGQQPLVPRVLVNRAWMHHFGRGIVTTPSDFGVLGAKPSHPELLDWLARRFLQDGWELKKLHRLLMTSLAYRQQSRRTDSHDAVDPENRLLGRMSVRRLEAEALRDSILLASGALNLRMLGPATPVAVDEVGQVIVGLDNRDSAGRPVGKRGVLGGDEFRRSVYVQVRRSQPLSMLEAFDAPTLNPNCEVRTLSTVAPQSLLLMNNEFVLAQAQRLAELVIAETDGEPAERITRAWNLIVATPPTSEQLSQATTFVASQEQVFAASKTAKDAPSPKAQALASLCQALFSSSAFLYVD